MSYELVVGGFGTSPRQMEEAAGRLTEASGVEHVGVNFRIAMKEERKMARLVRQACATNTHSGGIEAVWRQRPNKLRVFAAPVPTPRFELMKRAARSALELIRIQNDSPDSAVQECIDEITDELLRHPYDNLRYIGQLASCNSIDVAIEMQDTGIPTSLTYMESDGLFQPSSLELTRARQVGVRALILPGTHETFIHSPVQTMRAYSKYWDGLEQN